MQSIFANLGGGIRFNPKQNQQATEVFKRGWADPSQIKPVDFFNKNTDEPQSIVEDGELTGPVWEQKIKVDGIDAPSPFETWDDLGQELAIRPYLVKNIHNAGYKKPTPVQSQVIPSMMKNHEVLVTAPTGSGKTASYLVPLFHLLNRPKTGGVRAIIIIPTRELATQIETEANKLVAGKPFRICLLTALSGKAMKAEFEQSNVIKNADLLITTPARLVHIIENRTLSLTNVIQIILDESDKLLSDTFLEQMDTVISSCQNPNLIVSMFSATVSPAIEQLAKTIMKTPLRINVGVKNAAVKNVHQSLVYCGDEHGKLLALRERIRIGITPPVLIFVQTKERANALFRELVYDDINVDVITGERTDAQRDEIILQFRKGKIWFLIATDLMARGVDFKGINLVINYDMPDSPVDYIHRVGRTGRMGAEGTAITYYTDDDVPHLRTIVNVLKNSDQEVAGWLQTFQADKKLMAKLARIKEQNPTPKNVKFDKKRKREPKKEQSNEKTPKKRKIKQKSEPKKDEKNENTSSP